MDVVTDCFDFSFRNTSMVEFGNSLDPDRELDVLHGILDIPMEILEGDEDAGDWDIDNGQCLGPIPSNFLMELSSAFNKEFDSAPVRFYDFLLNCSI